MKKQSRKNTVADNIKGDFLPCHWLGYYLKDGSFAGGTGGTGYTHQHCETLAQALQPRYFHTLTVIDREQMESNTKSFNV